MISFVSLSDSEFNFKFNKLASFLTDAINQNDEEVLSLYRNLIFTIRDSSTRKVTYKSYSKFISERNMHKDVFDSKYEIAEDCLSEMGYFIKQLNKRFPV